MTLFQDLNKQLIEGQWQDGTGTSIYEDMNPYNGEVVAKFKMARKEDVDRAYRAAQAAQKEWSKVNAFDKSTIMENAARIMMDKRDDFIQLLIEETGSSFIKANVEIDFCISIIRESASFPLRMGGEMVPSLVPGKENRVYRNPLGVVGIISPFNFPMYLSSCDRLLQHSHVEMAL